MADAPKQQPSPPPAKVPPPESLPKLPKTIWNLEKRDSSAGQAERRSQS
jgi:hypothetical protein